MPRDCEIIAKLILEKYFDIKSVYSDRPDLITSENEGIEVTEAINEQEQRIEKTFIERGVIPKCKKTDSKLSKNISNEYSANNGILARNVGMCVNKYADFNDANKELKSTVLEDFANAIKKKENKVKNYSHPTKTLFIKIHSHAIKGIENCICKEIIEIKTNKIKNFYIYIEDEAKVIVIENNIIKQEIPIDNIELSELLKKEIKNE